MKLSLAAAFLAQALPNLVLASDPKLDLTRVIKHPVSSETLPSDIRTKFGNASLVKEVQPLKNTPVVDESRAPPQQSSEMMEVDVGILGFGYQEYRMEDLSSTIEMTKKRTSYDDLLFPPPSVCDPNSDYAQKTTCDCSDFDFDSRRGTFSCTSHEQVCLDDHVCGSEEITNSIYDDGSVRSDHCYRFDGPAEDYSEEVCYSQILSLQDQEESCGIYVNGELCNSCQTGDAGCHDFDCTNTDANFAGTNCGDDDDLLTALLLRQQESVRELVNPSTPFPPPTVCDINSSIYDKYNCDCSHFDLDAMQGSFGCITEENFCLGDDEFCGYNTITNTITEDGELHTHFCYYIGGDPDAMDVCYSTYGHDACSIHVQGVECTSCEVVDGVMGKDGNVEDRCTLFDCSNTIAGIQGMDCKGDHIFDAIIKRKLEEGVREQSDAASEIQTESMILKSTVLASGFLLKVETNNTSTSTSSHSGPL